MNPMTPRLIVPTRVGVPGRPYRAERLRPVSASIFGGAVYDSDIGIPQQATTPTVVTAGAPLDRAMIVQSTGYPAFVPGKVQVGRAARIGPESKDHTTVFTGAKFHRGVYGSSIFGGGVSGVGGAAVGSAWPGMYPTPVRASAPARPVAKTNYAANQFRVPTPPPMRLRAAPLRGLGAWGGLGAAPATLPANLKAMFPIAPPEVQATTTTDWNSAYTAYQGGTATVNDARIKKQQVRASAASSTSTSQLAKIAALKTQLTRQAAHGFGALWGLGADLVMPPLGTLPAPAGLNPAQAAIWPTLYTAHQQAVLNSGGAAANFNPNPLPADFPDDPGLRVGWLTNSSFNPCGAYTTRNSPNNPNHLFKQKDGSWIPYPNFRDWATIMPSPEGTVAGGRDPKAALIEEAQGAAHPDPTQCAQFATAMAQGTTPEQATKALQIGVDRANMIAAMAQSNAADEARQLAALQAMVAQGIPIPPPPKNPDGSSVPPPLLDPKGGAMAMSLFGSMPPNTPLIIAAVLGVAAIGAVLMFKKKKPGTAAA